MIKRKKNYITYWSTKKDVFINNQQNKSEFKIKPILNNSVNWTSSSKFEWHFSKCKNTICKK